MTSKDSSLAFSVVCTVLPPPLPPFPFIPHWIGVTMKTFGVLVCLEQLWWAFNSFIRRPLPPHIHTPVDLEQLLFGLVVVAPMQQGWSEPVLCSGCVWGCCCCCLRPQSQLCAGNDFSHVLSSMCLFCLQTKCPFSQCLSVYSKNLCPNPCPSLFRFLCHSRAVVVAG